MEPPRAFRCMPLTRVHGWSEFQRLRYNIILFSFFLPKSGSSNLAPLSWNMAFFVNRDFLTRVEKFESGLSKMDEFLNVRQIANLALDSKAHGHSSFEMLVFYYRIFLRRACEIFASATSPPFLLTGCPAHQKLLHAMCRYIDISCFRRPSRF